MLPKYECFIKWAGLVITYTTNVEAKAEAFMFMAGDMTKEQVKPMYGIMRSWHNNGFMTKERWGWAFVDNTTDAVWRLID